MKHIGKRLASLILCACILLGMPISVQANAGSNDPLTITQVDVLDDTRLVVTFSEAVNLPNGRCYAAVGIYKGTGNGLWRYSWDATNNKPASVAASGSTGNGVNYTQWKLDLDHAAYYQGNENQYVVDIMDFSLSKAMQVWDAIKAAQSDANVRLVVKFDDNNNTQNTNGDGINAITSKVGSKKLMRTEAASTAANIDWAEYVLSAGLRLTGAELYDSAHIGMSFSENVALPMGCEIRLGLYKNGVLDTTKGGPWLISDVDYAAISKNFNNVAGNAHNVLLGRIDGTTGKDIKNLTGTEYTIGLTITQPLADGDMLINGLTNPGKTKFLQATTSVGQDVAFSGVSAKAETLFTLDDITVINDTQAVLTFSEPVTMAVKKSNQTAQCFAGFYLLYDGRFAVYTWNGSSYSILNRNNATASTSPTSSQIAQFTGTVKADTAYGSNQLLFTLNANKLQGTNTQFSFAEIEKVVDAAKATGKLTRMVFRLGDPSPHANVTVSSNNRVESFTSANGTTLYAQTKNTEDMAEVTYNHTVSLVGAQKYNSDHMVLTFDQPINLSFDGVTATLGLYKNGVQDTEKGTWKVDLSAAEFFEGNKNQLLCKLPADLRAAAEGYTVGLVIESETNDNDGIVEGITGTNGQSFVANGTAVGHAKKDIVYVTVTAINEKLLTLDNVEIYNDSELVMTFSEPVNLPSGSYMGLNLLTGPSGSIMRYTYENGTYKVVKSLDLNANPTWAICQWTLRNPQYFNEEHTQIKVNLDSTMKQKNVLSTYSEIVAVSQVMPEGACFVFRIADTNASTQPGGNHRVEAVKTVDGTPLLATRKNDQIDQKQFVMPTDIRLNGAVIHNDKIVEMQFSSRLKLNTFAKNVTISIGQYDANGVLDRTKTSWPVTVTSTDVSVNNLAYNVFGTVAEMPQADEGYTLGLMITAKSGSVDGVIDGVLGHYSQKLAATHAVDGQDVTVASVSFSGEATLNVEKVEVVNDNVFILTFTEDIVVPTTGTYYAGLTLYNTSHNMMRYSWNGTTYQAQTGGTIDNSTLFGAQWTMGISRYGTSGNQLAAKIKGTMATGTPATYSEILKVVDAATDGKLVLRMADAVNNWNTPGYNGYVDAIGNDKKSLIAADWSYAEDQNEFEYTLIQKGLYVESAIVEDENTIKVTFSQPVKNVNAGSGMGNKKLRLVTMRDGLYHWTNVNGEYPQWGNMVDFVPADANSEYNDTWYYTVEGLKDLYAAATDSNSQFNNYILALGLLESIPTANADGYVQNYVNEGGDWLITNNTANDSSYMGITDPYGVFANVTPVGPSEVKVTSEDVITITFAQVVTAEQVKNLSLRFMNSNDAILYSDNGNVNANKKGTLLDFPVVATQADEEGKVWTLVMDLPNRKGGLELRTVDAMYEFAQEKGYTLVLGYAPLDGFMVYYFDIMNGYAEDESLGEFKIEKMKQTSPHELLITLSHDVADLVDMTGKSKPWYGLRLIDPSNGRLVRYVNGVPATSGTADGGWYAQWRAKSIAINGESRNQLLVTFADHLDIGNLIRQTNMTEELKDYAVMFSFEEADPGNGTFTAGNGLVHHLRRAADGKQMNGTFTQQAGKGADAFLFRIKEEDLIDPTAEVYVESIQVLDQTRIVATFSEAVKLSGGVGVVALVNTQLSVMKDDNGLAYEWGGSLQYYDDARTQVVFALDYTNRNKTYPMDGLDEIVNAKLEKGDYKLMFGIRDESGADGCVNAITTESGKILLSDLLTNQTDAVWCLIDQSQIPQGKLTITKIEVVSDIAAVATFSSPIEITGSPYLCVRWFNAEGRMVWMTKEGEYVYNSKTDGVNNSPMQWKLTWEWNNKEHTQLKLMISGGREGLANFVDLMDFDVNAIIEGSYLGIGMEEKSPEAVMGNWRIDNVTLASDSRISLRANLVKGNTNYDGYYLTDLISTFKAREVKITSARILNDMQMRITFSEPVDVIGRVYSAIRFINPETGSLLYWGDAYNRTPVQFGGKIDFENDTHTSMIWTMNGNSSFGANNIYDVVNYRNGLTRLAGTKMQFCVEEVTVEDTITVGGRNGLIDNLVSKDGICHVNASRLNASDSMWLDFDDSMLKSADMVELLSVKAIDDQTLEIAFSEPISIDETDENLTMAIRYLSLAGNSEVLTNGKTANFKGTWEYKDENKNVILWKLNSKNAGSLTEIFNFEGNLKWNSGARVCFVLMNDGENIPTKTMRMKGITDTSGYRHLSCKLMDIPTIQMDIEIAYDKPDPIVDSNNENEGIVEYYSNYTVAIIGGCVLLAVCAVVAVVLGKKKEGK